MRHLDHPIAHGPRPTLALVISVGERGGAKAASLLGHAPRGSECGKGEAKVNLPGRHPNSLAALRPVSKGEVRNPRGINGYSYRESFEKEIDRLLAAESSTKPGRTRGEALAELVLAEAEARDEKALALVMRRIWPEVRHLTITPDAPPERPDLSGLSDLELRVMQRITAKVREAKEIEVQGEHVLGVGMEITIEDDEEERHG